MNLTHTHTHTHTPEEEKTTARVVAQLVKFLPSVYGTLCSTPYTIGKRKEKKTVLVSQMSKFTKIWPLLIFLILSLSYKWKTNIYIYNWKPQIIWDKNVQAEPLGVMLTLWNHWTGSHPSEHSLMLPGNWMLSCKLKCKLKCSMKSLADCKAFIMPHAISWYV